MAACEETNSELEELEKFLEEEVSLHELKGLSGRVMEGAELGDVRCLNFLRNAMAKGPCFREAFRPADVSTCAVVFLKRAEGDRDEARSEAIKLLNNVVCGSQELAPEIWKEIFQSDLDILSQDDVPTLALLNACINADEAAAFAFSTDEKLLSSSTRCLSSEDEDLALWSLVITRKLAQSPKLFKASLATLQESEEGFKCLDTFIYAVDELLSSDNVHLKIKLDPESLVGILSTLAKDGKASALTLLGTAASTGNLVENAVEVSICGLQSAVDGSLTSARSSALRLLMFSVHLGGREAQNLVLQLGGIPLVLSSMGVDDTNPLMREWSVMCIRNLTEDGKLKIRKA
mmetsp:Transcript_8293/g.37051  ORF Transcript_8293/g.37051 Transcript_8293/m.37051 type:complete len:347 (-) Transcript_8293:1531-2571(-)|eukprot:CAMPEP_0113960680 /NCGR_PEP_ID=MMETSP0011_2-20120614/4860_1 /TAXON_ID=101924 /ORGANISM="Rhodosorus marinus" /LENGTH=346 /DNA_ID=CAMNT_0000972181 /DNA_START=275 /DNA_END=1315 /DNA_ORIENTATION=- /assembly_acc=CAM_ASM_000156